MQAIRALLVMLVLCVCAAAAPTQITDTLFNADGSRFTGNLIISWNSFIALDGLNVRAGSKQVFVVNGTVSVALEPATYTVVDSRGNKTFWAVPSSGGPVTVASIETGGVPGPSLVVALSQLGQNGATTNQVLTWNGTSWAPQTSAAPYSLAYAPVAFSAGSPVFNAAIASVFKITLTGMVTDSTITGMTAGQPVTFIICQDGTGNRTFQWPNSVHGKMTIGGTALSCSVQQFISDGAALYSTTVGVVNQ